MAAICNFYSLSYSVHSVVEWLAHLPATLDVTGFAPQLRRLFWELFSRVDTVSGTEGLKMVCVTLQELTVTSSVCGDNW